MCHGFRRAKRSSCCAYICMQLRCQGGRWPSVSQASEQSRWAALTTSLASTGAINRVLAWELHLTARMRAARSCSRVRLSLCRGAAEACPTVHQSALLCVKMLGSAGSQTWTLSPRPDCDEPSCGACKEPERPTLPRVSSAGPSGCPTLHSTAWWPGSGIPVPTSCGSAAGRCQSSCPSDGAACGPGA